MTFEQKLEYYKIKYFSQDKPVEYDLQCGEKIKIYPVLVEDWDLFEESYDILIVDKNRFGAIEMSQLQFLIEILFNSKEEIAKDITAGENETIKFLQVMSLCLKQENIDVYKNKDGKYVITVMDKDNILLYYINNKEYIEISKIILFQNIIDYDDRKLSDEVQEIYNDFLKLMYGNTNNPSFEEKKNYIIALCGFLPEQINKFTYRRFDGIYKAKINDTLFLSNKILEASMKFETKEIDKYYLFKKKKDKFDDFFSDKKELKNKVGQ